MHPDDDNEQPTAWDRVMAEHEARLTVGTRVRVLARPECYYCRSAEDEDGLIGVIEHVGYRNYRLRSEVTEPGERDHLYWVGFPNEIPSQGTHHSHFAAVELVPLLPDGQELE